jgi:bacteriorhodopsin
MSYVNKIVETKIKTMAEIHVEPKKQSSPAWIWILVSLIIVAVVVYFIMRNNKMTDNTATDKNTTSYIQQHVPDFTYYVELA